MPKFSVIVPLYNKENYIKATLKSVLQQTYTDFEIIIVDDGSTDKSAAIVKEFQDARIKYFYQENLGASQARNKAIMLASGEYLALLDADDLWYPNHLQVINRLILNFPNEKIFATGIHIQDRYGTHAAKYDLVKPGEQVLDFLKNSLAAPILSGSTTVLHDSIPEEIGYFDKEILSNQDTDYWIRIGLKYNIVFTPSPTATYVYAPGSLSNANFDFNRKTDFSKFDHIAINHPDLARFISYNRLAAYLNCVLVNDIKNAQFLKKKINKTHLNKLQKLTLNLPSSALKFLVILKEKLKTIGLRPVLFKK